jgi:hypothetical protein
MANVGKHGVSSKKVRHQPKKTAKRLAIKYAAKAARVAK